MAHSPLASATSRTRGQRNRLASSAVGAAAAATTLVLSRSGAVERQTNAPVARRSCFVADPVRFGRLPRPVSSSSLARVSTPESTSTASLTCAGFAAVATAAAFPSSRRLARRRGATVRAAEASATQEEAPPKEDTAEEAPPKEGKVEEEVAEDSEDASENEAAQEEAADDDAKEEKEEAEEKEVAASAAAKEKKAPAKQKWNCADCGTPNFPAATECHKCGAQKPVAAIMDLQEEQKNAKAEVKEVLDGFLRLQADLQNYRRDHDGSMSRAKDLGKQDALRKLVPFTTKIDEALIPPEEMTERETSIFGSYSLLFKKIHATWEKFGVEEQEVEVGSRFDPDLHRKAAESEPEGDEAPGTILEVLEQGWKCEGRVFIPSEVKIVAFPKGEEEEGDASEAAGEEDDDDEEEGEEEEEEEEEEEAKEEKEADKKADA